jgi:hypothetical protein
LSYFVRIPNKFIYRDWPIIFRLYF